MMALLWFVDSGTESETWMASECCAWGDLHHRAEGSSLKDSFIQNEVQLQKLLGNILALNSIVAKSPKQ